MERQFLVPYNEQLDWIRLRTLGGETVYYGCGLGSGVCHGEAYGKGYGATVNEGWKYGKDGYGQGQGDGKGVGDGELIAYGDDL